MAASTPNPDTVSAFAAQRASDDALTIMVIGKALSGTTAATISLAHVQHQGTAQVWQLTSTNVITRLADINVSATGFFTTLPGQSITLFVLPGGGNSLPGPPTNVRIVGSSGAP